MQRVVIVVVCVSIFFGMRQMVADKYGNQSNEQIICVRAICDGVQCKEHAPKLVRLVVVDDVYAGSKRIIIENSNESCE